MKRILFYFVIGISIIGLVNGVQSADQKPEKILSDYFNAIKIGRIDTALGYLSNELGDFYFGRTFAYANTTEETKNVESWNNVIKDIDELNKKLPFWRQRNFSIKPYHTLIVATHARVFFTYSGGVDETRAFQDFIFEDGEWKLTTAL